jgi:sirohydrochlorin cobaltochelatase
MKKSLQNWDARRRCGAGILLLSPVLLLCAMGCTGKSGAKQGAAAQAKPVILVVSFGTSYNDSRAKTIGAIEKAVASAYPDYEVRRAFTSQIIINVIAKRDGEKIDNVTEAMERLVKDGVRELIVQPTQIMNGFEYDDAIAEVKPFEPRFASVKYGKPLLSSEEDYKALIAAITAETKSYDDGATAMVFMGHGSEHPANIAYTNLNTELKAEGFTRYLVGTVEAKPDIADVLAGAKALGVKRAVLSPLMIVAGDHANNDMAGDEDDSWKSAFEAAGFSVAVNLQGLGEQQAVRDLFVRHVREAL